MNVNLSLLLAQISLLDIFAMVEAVLVSLKYNIPGLENIPPLK